MAFASRLGSARSVRLVCIAHPARARIAIQLGSRFLAAASPCRCVARALCASSAFPRFPLSCPSLVFGCSGIRLVQNFLPVLSSCNFLRASVTLSDVQGLLAAFSFFALRSRLTGSQPDPVRPQCVAFRGVVELSSVPAIAHPGFPFLSPQRPIFAPSRGRCPAFSTLPRSRFSFEPSLM